MKQAMIDKLRKERGCVWVTGNDLLVWNGDESMGVLVNDQKHYFEIDDRKGFRMFRFPERTPEGARKLIITEMKKVMTGRCMTPLNENLYGNVDERTSDQLRKVRE